MVDVHPASASAKQRPAGRADGFLRRTGVLLRRIALAGCVLCILFAVVNLALSGRVALWLAASVVPPIAATIGVLVTAGVAAAMPGRRRIPALLALLGLAVSLPASGLNPAALLPRAGADAGDTRPLLNVVSWNTQYWDQTDSPAKFYRYLTARDADVYLLQEYLRYQNGQILPMDDLGSLRRHFPGYRITVAGQLVTLVRSDLTQVGAPVRVAPDVLRLNLELPGGRGVSLYNVHIPAQLDPGSSALSAVFYRTLSQRDRARRQEYRALAGDLRSGTGPAVIAGDFNTTPAMGDIHTIRGLMQDAGSASRSLYPASWNQHLPAALHLWRLDWAFVRDADVEEYRFESPEGMSDHSLQRLTVRVGQR